MCGHHDRQHGRVSGSVEPRVAERRSLRRDSQCGGSSAVTYEQPCAHPAREMSRRPQGEQACRRPSPRAPRVAAAPMLDTGGAASRQSRSIALAPRPPRGRCRAPVAVIVELHDGRVDREPGAERPPVAVPCRAPGEQDGERMEHRSLGVGAAALPCPSSFQRATGRTCSRRRSAASPASASTCGTRQPRLDLVAERVVAAYPPRRVRARRTAARWSQRRREPSSASRARSASSSTAAVSACASRCPAGGAARRRTRRERAERAVTRAAHGREAAAHAASGSYRSGVAEKVGRRRRAPLATRGPGASDCRARRRRRR